MRAIPPAATTRLAYLESHYFFNMGSRLCRGDGVRGVWYGDTQNFVQNGAPSSRSNTRYVFDPAEDQLPEIHAERWRAQDLRVSKNNGVW
jgi:hypothetical protein